MKKLLSKSYGGFYHGLPEELRNKISDNKESKIELIEDYYKDCEIISENHPANGDPEEYCKHNKGIKIEENGKITYLFWCTSERLNCFKSFTIEEVDISRIWKIDNYDGIENIEYYVLSFNNELIIDIKGE